MSQKSLYFIGIAPPKSIRSEVRNFKEQLASEFGTSYALKNPSHITLQKPFEFSSKSEKRLVRKLKNFSQFVFPLKVKLAGFGHFDKRVLYIDVEDNQALNGLYYSLRSFLHHELDFSEGELGNNLFKPHMTLANKDLKPVTFDKLWPIYSKATYEREFFLTHMVLYKQINQVWVEHYELSFMMPEIQKSRELVKSA